MKLFKILILVFAAQIQGQEMFKDFKIKNISVNNKKQNYGASFYKDNSIVYSSENGGKLHLYSGKIVNGDVTKHSVFTKGSSSNTHESNVAFTKNFKTVYFTRSIYGKENVKKKKSIKPIIAIFKATISTNGTWSNIIEMPFNNKAYDVGHPTLNKENTKLYFSSNMPGGFGKSDIYVVDILENNTYSTPKNLGANVNTSGNELHPYISGDNYLYFSSNGHPKNLGGLDIYITQVNANGAKKVEHINAPVNSKWDDFSFIIDYHKRFGFFSSNRGGGKGQDDIYYFKEIIKEEPKEKPKTCNQSIRGTVFLNATNNIIPNTRINLSDESGKNIASFESDDKADFSFNIKCNKTYYINTKKEGYMTFNQVIRSSGVAEKSIRSNLFLVKIKKTEPKKRTVKPGEIGFNFNQAKLLKRYTYQLDKAIILMIENPKLYIEIESHTDSRAADELNMELSERRIENIVEYIASKGISSRNIRANAYGETKPLNHCVNGVICTEEEYLLNRRTTFKLKEKK